MNCSYEISVLFIVNLIKKKKDKIISYKNYEINAQFFFNSNLFKFIFEKNADIQNLYLFVCIILEKHVKDSNEIISSFIIFIKKFAVIINKFFDFNFLQKIVIIIIK